MTSDQREKEREKWPGGVNVFGLYMTTLYMCDGGGIMVSILFGKKTTILVVLTQLLIYNSFFRGEEGGGLNIKWQFPSIISRGNRRLIVRAYCCRWFA
jgi:hypothetical protein